MTTTTSTTHQASSLSSWLAEEPFGLTMSSGFFGFFAHCGMLSALEEANLLPERVTGSSAGALIAAFWAAGVSTEEIESRLRQLRKADFWDPSLGLGLLKGQRFRKLLEAWLPVKRFADLKMPLAVSTFDVLKRETTILDSGNLIDAVHASCCVPFLFQPVWIQNKPHLDGGIMDRSGLAGMPATARVLHHHLASRSPWRRRNSPQLAPPKRKKLTALVIHNLPRSGPDKIKFGLEALGCARDATRHALQQPIQDGCVTVTAKP